MAMIRTPNRLGLRTSAAASRTIACLGRVPPSWASRRTQFSTMMTLESTIRPKSMAPRLIRLADKLVASMMLTAKSIDRGIARATIRPPLRLPSITRSTTMTRTPPATRLCITVPRVRLIRLVRS